MVGNSRGDVVEVAIRRARGADARLISTWRSMEEMRRYQPFLPLPAGEIRRRLHSEGGASLDTERGRRITWILEADGTAAGWVTLSNIDWVQRGALLGFNVAPWAQRQGVGRRGVSLVLDRALGPGRLRRVEADCDVDNEASQRLLERLGFQREGRLRAFASMPQGRRDFYLYSLLSEEWPPASPTS
jgi:RimJ/RimL family protein N-acetyltransferase